MLKRPALGLIAGSAFITLALATPVAAATAPIAVTTPVASALTAAYASYRHIPASSVAGVRPGTLRTSYDAATRTHWATAGFFPSSTAGATALLGFQDSGSTGVFTRHGSAPWRMTGYDSVRAPRSAAGPARPDASASEIVQVANDNVGVGDTPTSTNFNDDCNPFATLVDAGATTSGCGTDPTYDVTNENQLWCADFAKWVWQQGGVSDTGVLDAAAASFYQWAVDQGQNPQFDSGTPEPGDAIVFYPSSATAPNSTYADHVGIVVGVNSDGTLDLDNGDFVGSSNITVQANDDVSVASWAAAVWGSGEQWIYVSPG